ncbi:MAG: DNA-3-methyladenine glycosylase 2 family protein [Pseudomonadota bacterium]
MTALSIFGDVRGPCAELAGRDVALGTALAAIRVPHIRKRSEGFGALFRIIVEQQVSVASAQAIWARCQAGVKPMTAARVLALGEAQLRTLGLTRQKAHYVYCLAEAVKARRFSFAAVARADDDTARALLTSLKGVGPWSAGIYLLFCEGRVDIWPPGDIAMEHAYAHAAGLDQKPASADLNDIAEGWAPWRGLAAHILWTYYAHIRGRDPI